MSPVSHDRLRSVLEWDSIVSEIAARCSSDPGKNAAAELAPLAPDGIRKRLRAISEIRGLDERGTSFDFRGLRDISEPAGRAAKGAVLGLSELFTIRSFIMASQRVLAFLKHYADDLPSLSEERDRLAPLKREGEALIPAMTDNGELNDARFPKLRRIRADIQETRAEIEKRMNAMVHSAALEKALQEKVFTTRNDRYVLLVKSAMRGRVRGTGLDVSASGATLFIEPEEIQPLDNRLIALNFDFQIETSRIMRELSQAVGEGSTGLVENLSVLAGLDLLSGAARFSSAIRASEPELADEPVMRLYGARHPLLYLMHGDRVVPNDLSLGESYNCLIISGANTGGKTVLLKTAGLCALMLRHGLHIPAGPDSRIGIFDPVMADIGDDQSIAQSLSSFSGQIVILKQMMERARPSALILIDEIVVGTNPRQGASLAQAVVEALAATGAKIVVTTHYNELKELASRDERFRNASVSFDPETLAPAYRLMTGIPGVSYALEIARIYGIPEGILGRAKELLDEREISVEALIEKTQKHEQEIASERERLAVERAAAAREKERYLELQRRQAELMENMTRGEGTRFLDELKEYRREIAAKIRELQQADLRTAGELRRELGEIQKKVETEIADSARKRFSREYGPVDPATTKPGDRVFVVSLEKEAVIESVDPDGESAELRLGNAIRARFRFRDMLRLPEGTQTAGARKKTADRSGGKAQAPTARPVPLTVQTSYNTIDLRGLRVDEAVDRMERDLDRMVRSGISSAVIIHGHGTGALKEAVRSRLRHSSYVRDFRSGEYGEGGDGVSIALLRE